MIFSQHEFSIGNPVQLLKRTSKGSREWSVQTYHFSFAGLLRNISTAFGEDEGSEYFPFVREEKPHLLS